MKLLNINKIFKSAFLVLLIGGFLVFIFRPQYKFFELNDSIIVKQVTTIPEILAEAEETTEPTTEVAENTHLDFDSLVSLFDQRTISRIDKVSKELNIVGLSRADVLNSLNGRSDVSITEHFPELSQAKVNSEYIWLAALMGIFSAGYIFVLRLRKFNVRFKDFAIFAVKLILLFIIQTIAFIGLISLVSRVYEVKFVDTYAIFVMNLITSFILVKIASSGTFSTIENLYVELKDKVNHDKGSILKLILILAILLPFGFGIKVISTLVFFVVAVFFSLYALELFNRANIVGIRVALPDRNTVTSMVRNIRIRKDPIMPLTEGTQKKKKKTETKKKHKKEKNKNRR